MTEVYHNTLVIYISSVSTVSGMHETMSVIKHVIGGEFLISKINFNFHIFILKIYLLSTLIYPR